MNKSNVWWMSMLGMAAAAGLSIWSGQADAGVNQQLEMSAWENSSEVLTLAASQLQGNYQVQIGWYGSFTKLQVDSVKESLEELGFLKQQGPNQTVYLDNQVYIDGSFTLVTGARSDIASDSVHAVLLLEADGDASDKLLYLQKELAARLDPVDPNGLWTTKAYGVWNGGAEPVDSGSGSQAYPELVFNTAAERYLEAKPLQVYREQDTIINTTFHANKLTVQAPGLEGTQLQAAFKKDSESGHWKLSIGAPMLTGEF